MRVPADHLLRNDPGDGGEVEPAALLRHAGVIDDLEQQVAQFIQQRTGSWAAADGVCDLVGLLDGVGGDGGEVLRPVPGAAAIRITQPGHDREEFGERRCGGVGVGLHGGGIPDPGAASHRKAALRARGRRARQGAADAPPRYGAAYPHA